MALLNRTQSFAFLLAAISAFPHQAWANAADDSACPDRLAAERTSTNALDPTGPPLRLPELSYRCMPLTSGGHIWLGTANDNATTTVLLVHGLGNNAHRDWANVVPALVPRFRVIAVDLPGFGSSPGLASGYSFEGLTATLIEVLNELGTRRVHVVGHSLGAAVSLHFTHAHPDRVDRLSLADAAGILHKAMVVRHMAQVEIPKSGFTPLDRLLANVDRRLNERVTLRLLRGMDTRGDFTGWLVQNPSIRNALLGKRTQVDAAIGLVEYDFSVAIRDVAAPTTVLWGRDDEIAPLRTGEMLASRMQNARLYVFDNAGHVPMMETPAQFNAMLLSSLTNEPLPKFNGDTAAPTHDVTECIERKGALFTGHYTTLTLRNCTDARIEFAHIGQLILESSTASMKHATLEHEGTALIARNSRLSATAIKIVGAIAVHADASELDFAGVTLRASQRAADVRNGARIYFSVSDVDAPNYKGDVHAVWTKAPD